MTARRRASSVRPYKPSGGWSGLIVQPTSVPALNKVLLASFAPQIGLTLTIRRTHVSLMFSSDQNAASENVIGAIGMGVFNDTTIAAGVAGLPDPVTDVSDDVWFLFQGLHSRISVRGTDGLVEPAGSIIEVDSKAMRKLPNGRSLALVVANADAVFGSLIQCTIRLYTTIARA